MLSSIDTGRILMSTQYSINKSKILLGLVGSEWEQHVVAELDSTLNQWVDSVPDHRTSLVMFYSAFSHLNYHVQSAGIRIASMKYSSINLSRSTLRTTTFRFSFIDLSSRCLASPQGSLFPLSLYVPTQHVHVVTSWISNRDDSRPVHRSIRWAYLLLMLAALDSLTGASICITDVCIHSWYRSSFEHMGRQTIRPFHGSK